jgi:hypothetical protein
MSNALEELLINEEEIEIKELIYEFRGKQVMLDSDLAKLFKVETRQLNQQMKRNISRFCSDIVKVDKKKISSTFIFVNLITRRIIYVSYCRWKERDANPW